MLYPTKLIVLSSVIGLTAACTLPISSAPYTQEIPSWASSNFTCMGAPLQWEARPSPGKGMGVFATRTLEPGDVIIAEPPIIKVVPPQFKDGVAYPLADIELAIRTDFDALSEDDKAAVMGLASYRTERDEWKDEVVSIFRTNAYIIGTNNTELGLFPKGARINHSCRPNSSQFWNDKLKKRVVYALKRIEEGEEIFATYIPLLHSHEVRQRRLDQYGFKCTCEACAQERAGMEASDKRRHDIRQAFDAFESQLSLNVPKSVSGRKKAEKNAKASLQLAELVEEEGLADYYAQAYRIVAMTHGRVEDWKPATIWAHKAYELRLMVNPKSVAALEMFNLTTHFITRWNDDVRSKSNIEQ